MRYYITNYVNDQTKNEFRKIGLYCYALRSKESDWQDIGTIENHVLVRRYGSIITNEDLLLGNEYPNDFLDFDRFSLENERVNSIAELKIDLEDKGKLDLSDEKLITRKFYNLFRKEKNYVKKRKLTPNIKLKYILNYYNLVKKYTVIDLGGHVYQLFNIKNDNNEKEVKND